MKLIFFFWFRTNLWWPNRSTALANVLFTSRWFIKDYFLSRLNSLNGRPIQKNFIVICMFLVGIETMWCDVIWSVTNSLSKPTVNDSNILRWNRTDTRMKPNGSKRQILNVKNKFMRHLDRCWWRLWCMHYGWLSVAEFLFIKSVAIHFCSLLLFLSFFRCLLIRFALSFFSITERDKYNSQLRMNGNCLIWWPLILAFS